MYCVECIYFKDNTVLSLAISHPHDIPYTNVVSLINIFIYLFVVNISLETASVFKCRTLSSTDPLPGVMYICVIVRAALKVR